MGTTRAATDPATLLFGSTRRRVLGWLLGHPGEAFYLRQLARQTGVGAGAVQRELEQLTAADLVIREVDGRQVYFKANQAASIFPELQSLFAKTTGLADVLKEGLSTLGDKVVAAWVFGSAARGGLTAASDVDVLVVGQVAFAKVVAALSGAQARLGREINPTVYSPEEFRLKTRRGDHFLTSVLREPRLFVLGGDDVLVELGAQRVADKAHDEPRRNRKPSTGDRPRSRR